MQRITPCLWFDNRAEEAAGFYTSVFRNSSIGQIERYGEAASGASGQPEGSVMTVAFELDGQSFTALNGGPHFKFSEAVSFIINCESQEEVDYYWEKLSEGGEEGPCGWLKDKFGMSWQIVPVALTEMLKNGDSKKANRVMQAILKMKKLDIKALQKACENAEE